MNARLRGGLAGVGAAALVLAVALAPDHARAAAQQSWPPFVLVAGLLLVGLIAELDGLFDYAAARLGRLPGPPAGLLLACYGLVALVTAVLNLDTAVVFLTPVLIGVARRRGLRVAPFLYGSVFMANASSLFLPGSNLTNLLVLSGRHVAGGDFAQSMLPGAACATLLTAAMLVVMHRRDLVGGAVGPAPGGRAPARPAALGVGATLAAAVLVVASRDAALPVLAVGLAAVTWRVARSQVTLARVLAHLNLPVLSGLFAVAVGLGTLARGWALPGQLMRSAGRWSTLLIAALTAIVINNLPAAVLLASAGPAHPRALLIGLNVGPNLAVTGALSALLWLQAARAAGEHPSLLSFSRQGVVLAPLAAAASLAVSSLAGVAGV